MAVVRRIRVVSLVSLQWEVWRQQMLSKEVRVELRRAIHPWFASNDRGVRWESRGKYDVAV